MTTPSPNQLPSFNKQNGLGAGRIFKAMACSFSGYRLAWINESAFRQEVLLIVFLLPIGYWIAQSALEFLFLMATLLSLLLAELFNSAIETLADRITLERDPMIKTAKDIGSAAVFSCLTFITLSWTTLAINRFFF